MHLPARTRLASAVAATALAATDVLACAGSASAEVKEFADGRGDTWTYKDSGPVKKPGHPEADLRRVSVDHTTEAVTVRARLVDLQKIGQFGGLDVTVVTSSGGEESYGLSVAGSKGAWKGEVALWMYGTDGSAEVECALGHDLDYAKDRITLSAPTTCFGDPEWVKVAITSYWAPTKKTFFVDNPANGKEYMRLTGQLTRG
jgi:hypothetical protein